MWEDGQERNRQEGNCQEGRAARGEDEGAGKCADPAEQNLRQGQRDEIQRQGCRYQPAGHLHRVPGSGHGAGRGRSAARPRGGDLRSGKQRQDHRGPALCRRGAESGRRGSVYRRRACAGPRICQEAGGQHRRSLYLPARYRRAGAGDLRGAGAFRRGGYCGH